MSSEVCCFLQVCELILVPFFKGYRRIKDP